MCISLIDSVCNQIQTVKKSAMPLLHRIIRRDRNDQKYTSVQMTADKMFKCLIGPIENIANVNFVTCEGFSQVAYIYADFKMSQ